MATAAVSRPSFGSIANGYLKTVDGVRNLLAKPMGILEDTYRLIEKVPGPAFKALAESFAAFRNITNALDAVLKLKPLFETSSKDFSSRAKIEKKIAQVADWTTSVYDLISYGIKSKVVVLTEKVAFRCLLISNIASMSFSLLNLSADHRRYQLANQGKVEVGDQLRNADSLDHTAIKISIAMNMGYLAFTLLGLPSLMGVAFAAEVALAIEASKILSFAIATVATVANHFWTERYIVPLDRAAPSQS